MNCWKPKGREANQEPSVCNRCQCPTHIPWAVTILAYATNRSSVASTCMRLSAWRAIEWLSASGAWEVEVAYPASLLTREMTQLNMYLRITLWLGLWFPCHLLEVLSRNKHSCSQWWLVYERALYKFSSLVSRPYFPISASWNHQLHTNSFFRVRFWGNPA